MKPRVKRPVLSVRMLPSAMTVAAICLGLSAVKFALDDRPTEAMAFLAVAAILDALDGRTARLLKATSKMGEEIDSLADAVNFGVAPAFIVYGTLLSHSRIGWIVVLLYAVCIVLRLARYNTMLVENKPAYMDQFFVGMPAPAGAIGAIGPLAAKMQFGDGWWTSEPAVVIWMIGVSLLAVSTIPMRKVHTFAISQNMVVPLLALLAVLVAASILYGYVVILLIIVGYVIHIPFAVRTTAWLSKHPEVWDDKPKAQRQARRASRAQAGRSDALRRTVGRWPAWASADHRGPDMTGFDVADRPAPRHQLTLTARLNTSAHGLPSRRGAPSPRSHCRAGYSRMGCDLADRIAHHRGRRRHRTGRHSRRHRPARRRHAVQCRAAGEHHRARRTRHGVRRQVGDSARIESGHPVDLVGDPAPGAARQGDDGGRHRVAAAARTRPRHPVVGGEQRAGLGGRHHLDV